MQFYFLFKLSNTSLSVHPFSLALSIKSALFASALVLALSGLGIFLAKVALYNSGTDIFGGPDGPFPRCFGFFGGLPGLLFS